ncbi:MAG: galactose-1-phosphate uridylyltransferase [Candidatus Paceibacterota bacterium]
MSIINEFREDLVSGEWVLLATGRAKRHSQFKDQGEEQKTTKDKCPFEDPEKSGNEVLATYQNQEKTDWAIKAIKNKFPAVLEGMNPKSSKSGPFKVTEGLGRHEVLVFKDHDKDLGQLEQREVAQILRTYQERYISIYDHGSMKYVLIFHNHGPGSGASIEHPHSQIMSIPILPPDVKRSIGGADKFYKENGKRVYDAMIEWEVKEKKRIVFENKHFIVFCPFVSKTPYEIRIFPKESRAHFEQMPEELMPALSEALHVTLKKVFVALDDPDYNFFIHTAPIAASHAHEFYTWHIEIIPRISMIGAFELGSGVDVNVVDPDEAAKEFKEAKI